MPSPKSTTPAEKISHYEGLRGLAALMVFVFHFLLAFLPGFYSLYAPQFHGNGNIEYFLGNTGTGTLLNGNFFVCVFFVLSGAVLSDSFFRGDRESPASGAVRRYFRLVMPVLVSVLIAELLLASGAYTNRACAGITMSDQWLAPIWNFPSNFFEALKEGLFHAFFDGPPPKYNPVLWTINIEFYGSLFTFAFLALLGKMRHRIVFYIFLCWLLWKTYMVAFVLGIAISDYRYSGLRFRLPQVIGILLFIAGVLLGGLPRAPVAKTLAENFPGIADSQFYVLGAALLIAGLDQLPWLQKLFRIRALQFAGRISFSLYLLNLPVLGAVSCGLFLLFGQWGLDYGNSTLCSFLISMSLLIFLAWAMTKWIDEPCTRMTKKLYVRWFAPASCTKEHQRSREVFRSS